MKLDGTKFLPIRISKVFFFYWLFHLSKDFRADEYFMGRKTPTIRGFTYKIFGEREKWQEGAVRTVLLRGLWKKVSISLSTSITLPSPLHTYFLLFHSIILFSHFCNFLCIKECLLSWLNHFKAKKFKQKIWTMKKLKRTSNCSSCKFVHISGTEIRIRKIFNCTF